VVGRHPSRLGIAGHANGGYLLARSATSMASTGWNRDPVGAGITGSLASALATIRIRSWN
jgi:hypothetical protein